MYKPFKLPQILFIVVSFCQLGFSRTTERPPLKIYTPKEASSIGVLPLKLPDGTLFMPRHDGKHFFITTSAVAKIIQPEQAEIDNAITTAETQGRLIKITSAALDIPAALKEVTSLPVTFRSSIEGWNYDITVLAMTFTPTGSMLTIGCKFTLPNNQSIYFGANNIATSGKNGFVGDLPILTSSLTNAKQAEIDDTAGLLGGEMQFYEFPLPNFNNNLWMGLDKNTKLSFECGAFKKFILSGFLKSYNVVERETADGTTITDSKPLMLFFGTKEIFDWQDIYFNDATVSRSFHAQTLKDLGFQFSVNHKAIIDLSKFQNPNNLPECINAQGWQGIHFPEFGVRLPLFFKRHASQPLTRTGKNIFITPDGLVGNMTAENLYSLTEGYTDERNKFDMSLDLVTASFGCNQAPKIAMMGKVQLKCQGATTGKLLYYNFTNSNTANAYTFFVKDSETGIYQTNKLTLNTGSVIEFGLRGNELLFNTKMTQSAAIVVTADDQAICSGHSTQLSITNCQTGMFKWSTTTGDNNISPLTVTPLTTQPVQEFTYKAICQDAYCVSEESNTITIKVYNGLPDLALTSNKSEICSSEKALVSIAGECVGKIEWSTPENQTFHADNILVREVNYPTLSATTSQIYKARCNLNGCISNQTNIATVNVKVKSTPNKPTITTDRTNNRVCSGQEIQISGACSNTDTFAWTAGLPINTPTSYTLKTDINTPQNHEYIYKATCTNEGCSSETELKVNEYTAPKPTYFAAKRNPVEIGGLVELVAIGCPRDGYVWSNGKAGRWDGSPANASLMDEHIQEKTSYNVKCVVNGCASLPAQTIDINVQSCEDSYSKPDVFDVSSTSVTAGERVIIGVKGCPNNNYQWENGAQSYFYGNVGADAIYKVDVYPTQNTEYKVRCVRDAGCTSAWVTVASVSVKGCEDSYSKPVVFDLSATSVTAGERVTIGVKGCPNNSYQWENGAASYYYGNVGAEAIYKVDVYPTQNTEYKVRCVRDAGCTSAWVTAASVSVKSCEEGISIPNSISSDFNDITSGTTVRLSASGCAGMDYEWSNTHITPSNLEGGATYLDVSVNQTSTFKVKCKKSDNCKSDWSGEYEVRVRNIPPAVVVPPIIPPVVPPITPPVEPVTPPIEPVTPPIEPVTTPETPPCTPPDAPTISADKFNLSSIGETATITANNCSGTVTWNNGLGTGTSKSVGEGIYNATCTVNDCVSILSNSVIINKTTGCPDVLSTITITADKINLCNNESAILTGSGCSTNETVAWFSSNHNTYVAISNNLTVTTAGNYSAVCRNNSCFSISSISNTITITKNTPPVAPSINVTNSNGTLTANGCTGSVTWSNGGNGISITPAIAGTYTATCTVSNACGSSSSTAQGVISEEVSTVIDGQPLRHAPPIITISTGKIYLGSTVTLSATCSVESTPVWTSPANFNGGVHQPSINTIYKAKCVSKVTGNSASTLKDSYEASRSLKVCVRPSTPNMSTNIKTIINKETKAIISASCSNGSSLVWADNDFAGWANFNINTKEFSVNFTPRANGLTFTIKALCLLNECESNEEKVEIYVGTR